MSSLIAYPEPENGRIPKTGEGLGPKWMTAEYSILMMPASLIIGGPGYPHSAICRQVATQRSNLAECRGPAAGGETEAPQAKSRQRKAGKLRILIVDDHVLIRNGLKQVLDEECRSVFFGEAGTADEALIQVTKQPWDLVTLEISIPGKDGDRKSVV